MPNQQPSPSRLDAAAILILAALLVLVLLRYQQPFPFDDAGFFLRYAKNLAAGDGYVWNPGVRDAIGASAPLWPLLLALPIRAGLEPYLAAQGVAVVLSFVGFLCLLSSCRILWGRIALLPTALAIASSGSILVCTMGGMETPLTVVLLTVAIRLLVSPIQRPLAVAACAAVLVVHKLDLAPWALGLLLASGYWRLQSRHRLGLAIAAGIVGAYFAGMWWATGHLFPVSLVAKLENSSSGGATMPWTWFLEASLVGHRRWLLLVPAALGICMLISKRSRVGVLLAVGVAGQALAYSLLPPTEPFLWYTAPIELAVALLVGGAVATRAARTTPGLGWPTVAITAVVCLVAVHVVYKCERVRRHWLWYSAHVEADRSRAGMWVAEHAPAEFRVVTGFGCPSFYCDRFVFDYSGLNMTGNVDPSHLIAVQQPELLIYCPFGTMVAPDAYTPPAGYVVAKWFDSSLRAGFDFYAVVAVRRELLSELSR